MGGIIVSKITGGGERGLMGNNKDCERGGYSIVIVKGREGMAEGGLCC